MGSLPLPKAEKKRAKDSRSKNPIRAILLRPKTWTTALAILRAIYGLVCVAAKVGNLFM